MRCTQSQLAPPCRSTDAAHRISDLEARSANAQDTTQQLKEQAGRNNQPQTQATSRSHATHWHHPHSPPTAPTQPVVNLDTAPPTKTRGSKRPSSPSPDSARSVSTQAFNLDSSMPNDPPNGSKPDTSTPNSLTGPHCPGKTIRICQQCSSQRSLTHSSLASNRSNPAAGSRTTFLEFTPKAESCDGSEGLKGIQTNKDDNASNFSTSQQKAFPTLTTERDNGLHAAPP